MAAKVWHEVTEDDVLAFNRLFFHEFPPVRRTLLVQRIGLTLLGSLLMLFAVAATIGSWPLAFAGAVIEAVMVWFLATRRTEQAWLNQTRAVLRAGRNLATLGWRWLTVDEQGVRIAGDFVDTSVPWPAIERVLKRPEAVYFFISANQAYIVPRRAFETDPAFEEFFAEAERLCRASRA